MKAPRQTRKPIAADMLGEQPASVDALPARVASAVAVRPPETLDDTRDEVLSDGSRARPSKIVPIRLREADRLALDRWGYVYPDCPEARVFVRAYLAHAANLIINASKRMDNFLELRVPWMPAAERQQAKERAFRELETWTAEELGQLLGLRMEERVRLRIGSIAPIDCDRDQREERAKRLHRQRSREYRRRKRPSKPVKLRARSEAILRVLPLAGPTDMSQICDLIGDAPEFLSAKNSLRFAVYREIQRLRAQGLIETKKELRKDGAQSLLVRRGKAGEVRRPTVPPARPSPHQEPVGKSDRLADLSPTKNGSKARPVLDPAPSRSTAALPSNEREYREHLIQRLAQFTPETVDQLGRWFHSERPLREACGVERSLEFRKMYIQRERELSTPKVGKNAG